jgi:spore maturation protein CgeB
MRVVMFYHSVLSDWNHGNAHFLRGIATELSVRGHKIAIYEPRGASSLQNLVARHGAAPLEKFRAAYPRLSATRYDAHTLDLDEALQGADLVLVHESNDRDLVRRIGEHRARNHYCLLFHDTHHRLVTDTDSMADYDLSEYDGVLAYGEVLRQLYDLGRFANQAWTWHEAADTRVFRPLPPEKSSGDLVWMGNWGDDERAGDLQEFLIEPVKTLGLQARIHGVGYPASVRQTFAYAGIGWGGWLPNHDVPRVFSEFKCTIDIPRHSLTQALPGVPTIRVFESLACGIPLVCAPWEDVENLFTPGKDYLIARNSKEMAGHLRDLLHDEEMAAEFATRGFETVRARHTCAHRVDELLAIYAALKNPKESPVTA